MRLILISGRLPHFLKTKVLPITRRPEDEFMIIVNKIDSRAPKNSESFVLHLNRPENSLAPFFPEDSDFFEGVSACDATKIDDHEMFVVTVLAENAVDAQMVSTHTISFIQELAIDPNPDPQ